MKPTTAIVDLGYRGVDHEVAPSQMIHRGQHKTLTDAQRRCLKRRQAIEPAIGHTKHGHGMHRCWLKGSEGDAFHAVLCAPGFNIRWLLRAIVRLGLAPLLLCLCRVTALAWIALYAPWPSSWAGHPLNGSPSHGAELVELDIAGPT